jgi:hypothetical protein
MQTGKDLPGVHEPHSYIHFSSNVRFQLKQFANAKSYIQSNLAKTNIPEYEYDSVIVEYYLLFDEYLTGFDEY